MDQNPRKKAETKDEYDVDIQSCSAMDCTGLIPSLPQSFAEVEHYNDCLLYTSGLYSRQRRQNGGKIYGSKKHRLG